MENVLWASVPLRLVLGLVFTLHGLQKAAGAFGGPGMKGFSQMIAKLGVPLPAVSAYASMIAELAGGISLLAGFLTRFWAGLLVVDMLVAIFKVHLRKGFFNMEGGFEYQLVIIAACVALMILGGGKLSLTGF